MIDLQLPLHTQVRGALYHRRDPGWLTQDVMEVELSNGVVIDVGWYPEHDLSGTFVIRAFDGDWDKQLIDPIERQDPNDVCEVVEQLAEELAQERHSSPDL